MALGLWLCVRATYVADMSAFLPAQPRAEQQLLVSQLQAGATSRVLLVGLRGGDAPGRAEASRRLAQALRASGAFESVNNGDNAGQEALGRVLFEHRYLLSPAIDAQRFTVEGLREALLDTASLLGTPAGAALGPLVWRDPTGEVVRIAETMIPASAPRMEHGVWMSRTEPRALLLATSRADGSDLDGQARAQDTVRRAFEALRLPALQLELSGPGTFAVQSRAAVQAEVERLALLDTVALLGLLLVAFGRLLPLGLALLPVASGVVAGIVAVHAVAGQVHGITLGFGITLIGEAVDYGIYYLVQARQHGRAGWLRTQWPTVRLGLLTSVAGFAALAVAGFSGLAQLGVFAVSGLVAAALTTRFLLPVLAPQGTAGRGLRPHFGRALGQLSARAPAWRTPLALAVLAGAALLLALPSPWRGTLAGLSPIPQEALALDASLRADLGASESGLLVAVQGPDEGSVLQAAERAGERLDALVAQGRLLGYQSPATLLPSPATQLARRGALPEESVLRQRLETAAAGGPFPPARLSGFIADVQAQRSREPLRPQDLAGTPLATALAAQLVPGRDGSPWQALIQLQLADEAPAGANGAAAPVLTAAELRQALQPLPGVQVLHVKTEIDAIYADYLQEALKLSLLGALAVVALLAAQLRDGRRLLRVLAPLAGSTVAVLAAFTLAGVALGVLHLVGLLLVVAIGSNYALFFDHLQVHGQADPETLASLLIANLTTVASFAILATADIPALAAVGQTVAPGAALSLLLAAAFCRGGPANAHGRIAATAEPLQPQRETRTP
nr:MMPL family transporter [Ramlibacter aurantiacus]